VAKQVEPPTSLEGRVGNWPVAQKEATGTRPGTEAACQRLGGLGAFFFDASSEGKDPKEGDIIREGMPWGIM